MRQLKFLLPMALLALLALGSISCSSDDDGGGSPTGNNNPPAGDDFDQATAVAQSHASSSEGTSLVQSMQGIAQGVGQPGREDGYGWNPGTQQYEWHYEWNMNGYTYVWDYVVQYLDDMGDPQQASAGAAEILHSLEGTGHYAINQQGADIDYDYLYEYYTSLTGMGTGTLLMTGNGGTEIDYTYS